MPCGTLITGQPMFIDLSGCARKTVFSESAEGDPSALFSDRGRMMGDPEVGHHKPMYNRSFL
jgi:hypothetical protein